MENAKNREKGNTGEDQACVFLQKKQFKIIERNWTCGKLEIDIVAETSKHLVFVEVKKRHSKQYKEPWEAVNKKKQTNIMRAANFYIKRYKGNLEPRFDIISIVESNFGECEIEHIENAFWPMAY